MRLNDEARRLLLARTMASNQAVGMVSRHRCASAAGHDCRGQALVAMFAALGLGMFGTISSGCGANDCTLLDWNEGLTVDFLTPDLLPDGSYKLAVEADGVAVDLAVDFEDGFATCAPGGDAPPCSDVVALTLDRNLHASIELAVPINIGVNVYYTDGGSLAGGPERASIRLQRDGETILEATFEPSYVRDEPNGDGCGVATRAGYEVTVPPQDSALAAD